jgi:hypothetical protein
MGQKADIGRLPRVLRKEKQTANLAKAEIPLFRIAACLEKGSP